MRQKDKRESETVLKRKTGERETDRRGGVCVRQRGKKNGVLC